MESVEMAEGLLGLLELALVQRLAFPVGPAYAGVAHEALDGKILLGLVESHLGSMKGDDPPSVAPAG